MTSSSNSYPGTRGQRPIRRCCDHLEWSTSSKHYYLRHTFSSTPEDLAGNNPNSPHPWPKKMWHLQTRPCEYVLLQQETHTELSLHLFVSRFVIKEKLVIKSAANNDHGLRYGSTLTISLYGIPVILWNCLKWAILDPGYISRWSKKLIAGSNSTLSVLGTLVVSFPTEEDTGILMSWRASRALPAVRPSIPSVSLVKLAYSLVADVLDAAATLTSGLFLNPRRISGTSL